MTIKKTELIRWIIVFVYFFLAASNAFNLVLLKGFTGYDYVLTFLIGIVVSYFVVNSSYWRVNSISKEFKKYYKSVVLSILILAIYTVLTYRLQSVYLTLRVVSQYILMIWAVPIFYVMKRDGSISRIMETINILAVAWCVLILTQSFYYNMTGRTLFGFVDASTSGIRNDTLRITTGCLSNVALIYCFWKFFNGKLKKNIYYVISFVILCSAMLYVAQSRAYTVVIACTLSAMVLFDTNNQRKFIRKILFVGLIACLAFGTDFIQSYYNSIFTKYEISVSARTYAYGYYWSVFLKNPIFGFGLLKDQANYGSIYSGPLRMAFLDDVGVVGQLAMLGVFFIPIVIGFYVLLFRLYFRAKKIHGKNTLLIGLLTYMVLTSLTLMVFDQQRVCIVAPIIALFEFYATNNYK